LQESTLVKNEHNFHELTAGGCCCLMSYTTVLNVLSLGLALMFVFWNSLFRRLKT